MERRTLNCSECGSVFKPKVHNAKYCSAECSNKVQNRTRKRNNPLRGTYAEMIQRCYNEEHKSYEDYGGRGIVVCDEWLDPNTGYAQFCSDMGTRPEGHTMDRIDPDGPYSPQNCRWATSETQNMNKRYRTDSVFLEHPCGLIASVAEWSRLVGVKGTTIRWRLSKGWPVAKVLA